MFSFIKKLFANNKKGLFFIHIPKTAGTSFINILDATVDDNKIFPAQLWQQVNEKLVAKISQYTLLRGHFGGGAFKLLTNGNPHRLTILRHPQSLSVSTYHFIKREKNAAVHDLVIDKKMDLRTFLEEPITAQKINNRMVRHLSFDLQQDPEAQELFLSAQSIKVVSKWIKTPKKINDRKRLLRAKKALDGCSWFGVQEKFDQSMQLFAYTFKRPPIGKTAHLNAHKPNQNIDNYCINLINNQNTCDLQLYAYAQERFEQRYKDMCQQLAQLGNIECTDNNTDELLDINYQKNANYALKKNVDYDFANSLLGSGWHRREIAKPENSYFRWTNCAHTYIDFWVKPQDYKLSVRIINAVSSTHLNELDIQINNTSIPYKFDQNKGVVRILTANISKSFIKNNLLRIYFNHDKVLKHQDVFDSGDERNLGIAINWIKIKSC